ncbi:terminase large subunit domain-containing protein [Rhodococcus sp. ANT_H53B]|uniref:terminase large subunit domain-containing protein n=1 Tax=Rhodococcus sp. ANT_H53B TaxID=2597357 RepID=UPI0011EC9215|nr:terminase family protein [Rhodococcus sp. ANT_H53B]KAA0925961.1 hypothetical protein FQ188_10430 [Rhodococcus sp. ANT_H53B]
MEWQQLVVDVALEVDGNGDYVYPLVVITVPRQSGKTTLILAMLIHRCLQLKNGRAWHTAQTGLEAVDKWGELADQIESSPFKGKVKVRRSKGSEMLIFPNGSTLRPHPPKQDSLHGKQSDINLIDEAWTFDLAKGMGVIQAITPTQATREGAQTVITSTQGTASSVWFNDYVDRGRSGVADVAYFEWAIPDDVDPTDLTEVSKHHPAFGKTIKMKALKAAFTQMLPGEFARAYGNRRTQSLETVIPLDAWNRVQTEMKIPNEERVAFGAAVSIDRKSAAIVAAATVEGVPIVELIEFREGSDWVGPRLKELYLEHHSDVVVDRFGPSATVAEYLDLNRVPILPTSSNDVTAAAAGIYDRIVMTGMILVRPNVALTEAVKIASKRKVGDGWTWSRQSDTVSIAPLESMTLAVRAITHIKPAPQKPVVSWAAE